MSEKRFEISRDKYFIFDNAEDDFLDLEDVVIMLNEFEEKCERLVKENNRLREEKEDIVSDLCPTCIYCGGYESEVSSAGYVRTTYCNKRGTVKGVLSECNDYSKVG